MKSYQNFMQKFCCKLATYLKQVHLAVGLIGFPKWAQTCQFHLRPGPIARGTSPPATNQWLTRRSHYRRRRRRTRATFHLWNSPRRSRRRWWQRRHAGMFGGHDGGDVPIPLSENPTIGPPWRPPRVFVCSKMLICLNL